MKIKIVLLGAVILLAGGLAYYKYVKEYGKSIHIAFAGPGEETAAGLSMIQAIQLYFDKINERGGINGKKIVLEQFDDKNDATTAEQQAKKIVEKNRAVAVIGHWYSSASISAGKIYKKHQIPAITPGSANIKVTLGNEWYFRNIYNAKASGQFLANYVKNVFKQNKVSIIRETAPYGDYLAKVFEKQSLKLGLIVENQWSYDKNKENLGEVFRKIVSELNAKQKEAGVILLAVQANEGVQLVKLIKEASIQNAIIGASSLSEKTFSSGFDGLPMEKEHPGFYTNDIYVATPLIFDTANEKAQHFKELYQNTYNEVPGWAAAYAYDTAMLLVEAIKKAKIEGTRQAVKTDRRKIKDALGTFNNIFNALEGVTGLNYFDENRDAQKPVSIGIYKHKNSVSALTQLQVVRHPNEITDLENAMENDRVLLINEKQMYKTNVVYAGVEFIDISDIDIKNLQFTLDFKLWFRFQGNFNPDDIDFLNAINHQEIREQLKNPIENKRQDKITYRVYRIKSRFKADFIEHFFVYKQHIVGISFRHRTLTRNNLIYVTDVVGMGQQKGNTLVKSLLTKRVLSPVSGWTITRVLFFPDIVTESSAGDPDYLNVAEGLVEYSQFNAAIQIKKDQFSLRGTIPYQYAYHLMLISGTLFLILTFAGRKRPVFSKVIWFFQVIFAFILLLSGEIIFFSDLLAENTNTSQVKFIVNIFDILWWLIPAFLLNEASERFIWAPLAQRIGAIPNIIRHFFALLVYLMAIIGIIVFVYEQRFTSLLAASGMLAMIIGLAIQINISNVFSGIVINMESPFRIGDWVKIGKFDEGEVIDINWRATRIQGRNQCIISIPNSVASDSAIINFFYPDKVYWLWPTVYVHPRHPPERVKKVLLDALLSADQILKEPAPVVFLTGINEWAASYWIAFCANDYANKFYILENVWTRVWFHLNRANISPAVMRQEFHIFKGEKDSEVFSTPQDNPLKPEEMDVWAFLNKKNAKGNHQIIRKNK
jgi:potassium-dependent mechanosensitive channel